MMTPELFQKWLDITKVLGARPATVVRCPQCEKADLEVQEVTVPGYEGVRERYARCPACETRVALLEPRGVVRTSAAGQQGRWTEVRERLLLLGWTPETVDVEDGLRSPHNAMVISAEMVDEDARRAMLDDSLRRHSGTLRWRINENAEPDIECIKDVLGYFQQLLDCLGDLEVQ